MSWAKWILLESPVALGVVLLFALFVLLVIWRRTGQPRPLLVGLVAAVLLFAIQAGVTTQRERAGLILSRIEADIVAGQTRRLAEALAPHFDADRSKSQFLDYVRAWMERVDVRWVRRQQLDVTESAADRFTVEAGYLADITTSAYGGSFATRWRIAFERMPGGWQIVSIHPLPTPSFPVESWRELSKYRD